MVAMIIRHDYLPLFCGVNKVCVCVCVWSVYVYYSSDLNQLFFAYNVTLQFDFINYIMKR